VELKPETLQLVQEELRSGHAQTVDEIIVFGVHALREKSKVATPPPKPREKLADFLLESPLRGSGLQLERQKDYPRPVGSSADSWSIRTSSRSSSSCSRMHRSFAGSKPPTRSLSSLARSPLEIRLGIEDLAPANRRADLEQWLDQGLPHWFEDHLLPITKAIVDRWGRLTIQAKRRGVTITTADGLITTTALEHDLAIVTRNVKDFAETGATVINPWVGT
jgi:predicted nucleic acid-binding protein